MGFLDQLDGKRHLSRNGEEEYDCEVDGENAGSYVYMLQEVVRMR